MLAKGLKLDPGLLQSIHVIKIPPDQLVEYLKPNELLLMLHKEVSQDCAPP